MEPTNGEGLIAGHDTATVEDGALVVRAGEASYVLQPPYAYQDLPSGRLPVASRFVLDGDRFGFESDWPFPHLPLVIDPKVGYASFFGGAGDENVLTMRYAHGDPHVVLLAGYTSGTALPTKGPGSAYQLANGGGSDGFIAALDTSVDGPAGLLWATYFGGSGTEYIHGLDTDASGIYAVGTSSSLPSAVKPFPATPNAYQKQVTVGNVCTSCGDAFIARFSLDGKQLLYASLLGGGSTEVGNSVASEGNGKVVIAGWGTSGTYEPPFPTKNAFQADYADRLQSTSVYETWVARFDTTQSGEESLVYATLLGGGGIEYPRGVAVAPNGDAFVTGVVFSSSPLVPGTAGTPFPTSPGAYKSMQQGADVFVSMVPANGGAGLATLPFSTLLGGVGNDYGQGIAYDAGTLLVTGYTMSGGMPTHPGAYQPGYVAAGNQAFLLRLDPTKTGAAQVVGGTYFGGNADAGHDEGRNIVVDADGEVWLFGWTQSPSYPAVKPVWTPTAPTTRDAFVARFTPDLGDVLFSSRLGSAQYDYGGYEGGRLGDVNVYKEAAVAGYLWGGPTTSVVPGTEDPHIPAYSRQHTAHPTCAACASYEAWLIRLAKAEPMAKCTPIGPFVRGQAVQVVGAGIMTDAAIDPKSFRWWFDAEGPTYDPERPDIEYDRNGDGKQDAGYGSTVFWTYPANGRAGDRVIRLELRDVTGLPPDTAVATCSFRFGNMAPDVYLHLDKDAVLGGRSLVTARGPQPTIDPDNPDPFGGLTYYWAVPDGIDCVQPEDRSWEQDCEWKAGTYTFALAVSDSDGAVGYDTLTVMVREPRPVAAFDVQQLFQYCGPPPPVTLTDTSTDDLTPIAAWAWDFGDDGTTDATTSDAVWHAPPEGRNTVRLTVTDGQGYRSTTVRDFTYLAAPSPTARLSSSQQGTTYTGVGVHLEDVSEPAWAPIVTRLWGLGDEGTASGERIVHAFRAPGPKLIRLLVVDGLGCSSSASFRLDVEELVPPPEGAPPPPFEPRFLAPVQVAPGQPVWLHDVTPPLAQPFVDWAWELGDGTSLRGEPQAIHRYKEPGTYTVTLRVWDAAGASGAATRTVEVAQDAPARSSPASAPMADGGADIAARPGATVVLDATRSLSPAGLPLAFHWEQLAGPADDLVVVRVDSRAPQIVAQAEAGGEVRFAAELPPGATAAWEFGDGATSGEPQPRHTYARSGTYTVRLLVDGEAVQQVVEVDVRQGLERQRPVQEHAPAALAGLPLAHVLAAFAAVALVVGAAAFALARRQ